MNEFLTVTSENHEAEQVLLLIPDIWGLTEYNQSTAQSLAIDYARPSYILDYFYQLTNQPSIFDSSIDSQTAPGLMEKMRGEDFVEIFNKAIIQIKLNQPKLKSIQVVGFCFGGRLAYLSGLEKLVDKIIVFYGAGALKPDFYQNKNVIETLCQARAGDQNLKVLAFFGSQDQSIPANDQASIQQSFESAKISYEHHEYNAGHAYFQQGRPSFDSDAAQKSKHDLDNFLT